MADINNNIQVNVITNVTQVKKEAEQIKKAYSELKNNLDAASAAANLLSGAFNSVGLSGKAFDEIKKTISGLASTVDSLSTVMTTLQKRQAAAAVSAGKLTIAQKAVNIAMKAFPIFAIISAIGTLIDGIKSLVSWLWGESDACEAATEALEKYQEVAQQTQTEVQKISREESSIANELKEKHRAELIALKERGATAVELSETELRQQKELADVTIEASEEREEQLKKEKEANEEAVKAQSAYVAELEVDAKKNLQTYMEMFSAKIEGFDTEEERQEFIAKLRMKAYEDTEEERKKLEELTNQQDALNNKLRDEAAIRLGASNTVLEKGLEVDGAKSNQSQEEKNEADRQRKKYADIAKQSIQQKKELNVALLKSQKDYLSADFATKQEYDRKLFKEEEDAAKELLDLKKRLGELSQKEYEQQCQLLALQRTQFENRQLKDQEKHAKSLLKELQKHEKQMAKMAGDEFKVQRMEVTEEYQNTIKDIEALMKMLPKDPFEYEKLAEDIVKTREQMAADLKAIDDKEKETKEQATKQKKYEEDIKAANDAADAEFAIFADNEQKKYEVEIERLQKIAAAKKELGMDASEELAAIEAAQLAKVQANTASRLAADNLSAKERYKIKREGLEAEKKLLENNKQSTEAIQQEIADLDKAFQEERFERIMDYANKAKEVMSGIFELGNAQDEAKLQKASEQNEQEKQQLQAQLDANLISKDEYNKKVKQSDDKLAKEQAKIKRKQAIQDKATAIFDAAINTATSIIASSKMGFPAAIPFIAMAAASGALQTAAILAAPLPKAARGMHIKGASHAMGGVQLEAEGGEMVINKRSSSMFAPLLSAINEAGGGVPFVSSYSDGGFAMRDYQRTSTQGITSEAIASAVKEAVQEVKIYTAIEDINDGNKKYAAVTDSSKF